MGDQPQPNGLCGAYGSLLWCKPLWLAYRVVSRLGFGGLASSLALSSVTKRASGIARKQFNLESPPTFYWDYWPTSFINVVQLTLPASAVQLISQLSLNDTQSKGIFRLQLQWVRDDVLKLCLCFFFFNLIASNSTAGLQFSNCPGCCVEYTAFVLFFIASSP